MSFSQQLPGANSEARRPGTREELGYWLRNMAVDHGYSRGEMCEVLGMTAAEVEAAMKQFGIREGERAKGSPGVLRVKPYPGGRHPRIGFLDGAIRPQRETKLSLFTPWDPTSYVVLDVPEAIWSNLGLTYLAHTHIDTVWSKQGVVLPRLEWVRETDGSFRSERTLPNGLAFGVVARPVTNALRVTMWLKNGTASPLSDLRVQMCAMLKGARGFDAQTQTNKIFRAPFAACRSEDGSKWIIHAWRPCFRPWGNPPCPCLHSDPKFPDCPAGESREVDGWISFYEGTRIEDEFRRIESIWLNEKRGQP